MNSSARKHLDRAAGYVAKGEEFYERAGQEMRAAKDSGATWVEIADALGRGESWVRRIVVWSETPANKRPRADAPFGGSAESTRKSVSHARSTLLQAPPSEIVDELLSDPQIRRKLQKAQDMQADRIVRQAKKAEREALGDEASDQLATQQILREAEGELFKARRALIRTLQILNSSADSLDDSWREELLRTFDDVADKADLGRQLLTGNVGDELDRLLAEEGTR